MSPSVGDRPGQGLGKVCLGWVSVKEMHRRGKSRFGQSTEHMQMLQRRKHAVPEFGERAEGCDEDD